MTSTRNIQSMCPFSVVVLAMCFSLLLTGQDFPVILRELGEAKFEGYRAFAQGMQFVVVLEVTGNNANPPDEIPEHVLSLPINATSCPSFKLVIIEMIGATDLTIDCNTTNPNANVTLLLDNVRLPVGGRVTLHKQVFTIHNISTRDTGRYKCVTSSGSSMTVFCQTVIYTSEEKQACCPKVTPEVKVMEAGMSTNFTCKAYTFGSLSKYFTLKWLREENGTSVEIRQGDTMHKQTVVSYGHSVLTITNAQLTPAEGVTYRCQITYRGTASSSLPLRLIVVKDFAPNIIFLKSLEESGTVKEKDKLSMRCQARSFPLSNITWIHNGAKMSVCLITRSQDCMGKSYKVLQDTNKQWLTSISQLIIESTSFPRDNGTYTCVARNSKSYDEKNLEISIETVPTLDKSKSFWTSRRIYCEISQSNPLPTFKWQHQNGPCLNFNPECYPDNSNWKDLPTSFVISPPSGDATYRSTVDIPLDTPSGFLRCLAANTGGSDENMMRFFASGMDSVRITTATKEYDEDDTLSMRCVRICRGKMTGWYKDGRQLLAATDPRINVTFGTESDLTWTNLVVEKLTVNDSGVYICAATDCQSKPLNVSRDIKVNKVFPPSILNFENQTAYHQISSELFCNVSAHPMPSQVQWFRGSQPLRNQIEVMDRLLPSACKTRSPGFYRVNGVVGKLIICKPADTLHTGFYTCKAANRKGESNATAFLNVLENPVIIRPANGSRSVELGEPWNSTCVVTGNPVPKVEWKRVDGNLVFTQKQYNNEEVVLMLESVSKKDLGMYLCVAVNSKGIAVAFVELAEADNPQPSTAPEGSSRKMLIALSVVGVLLFVLLIVILVCYVFFRRQRQKIKEYQSQFFPVTFEHAMIARGMEFLTSKQQTNSAYVSITGDNRPANDYYVTPYNTESNFPQTSLAGLNRQTSDDVESSPSLPLSRDMDTEQELDQDERYRMVDLGAGGSLSGNESGISLEEGNDEASAVAELRPLRVSAIPTSKVTAKAKLKSNSKETEI
ncbi:hypothetical protein pdam_00001669 [Pocillopora damicornis]|uniref:Ig-like domain-containing protein n=1 Tax=Pocillopora damicornis TaxID=46731 RepID=A0A3M6UPS3_POCDA|nr:hypothetical protein pdam_00001669 [Pocillopora damicornis]